MTNPANDKSWTGQLPTRQQSNADTASGKRNGVPQINRPTRTQLLFDFDLHREVEESRQYFLPDAYTPSTAVLSQLKPIPIADLQSESRHEGCVLFIRNIEDAVRFAAVHTIIEDVTGAAERLALYNTDAATKAEDVLPVNALFAVKEPYYTASPNGGYTIRVDHPSDLIELSPTSPLFPVILTSRDTAETPKSALEFKDSGNIAFKAKQYAAAYRSYTHGLDACVGGDEDLRRVILRNRATVNMNLQRYESALVDATDAIILKGGKVDTQAAGLNSKAYYRAGRAKYELGRYDEAEDSFLRAMAMNADDKDAMMELGRASKRVHEQETGDYDWIVMSKSANKRHNRLDHADYTLQTEIKDAGAHGRGLFITQDLKAGELILCEKAFRVSFDSDPETAHSYAVLDPKTQRGATDTQATLLFGLVEKLMHSPQQAKKFFHLDDDGDYTSTTTLDPVDGIVPVDTFRTRAILDHNSYGCPTVRSSSSAAQNQVKSGAGYPSTGLWLRASYINHACDGNAMRSFIGDMMIVRATKDVAKGDEIMMPYRLPHFDNSVTQGELEKVWGFRCDCGLCAAEAETPLRIRKERLQLVGKAAALISSSHPAQNAPNKKALAQAERLYGQIEKTYNEQSFKGRPRLGLVDLGKWLCEVYSRSDGSHEKLEQASVGLLRDMGIVVTTADDQLKLDLKHCQVHGTAVDAGVYAATAFRRKKAISIGKQMHEFAKEGYIIMNADLRGFEEAYAK